MTIQLKRFQMVLDKDGQRVPMVNGQVYAHLYDVAEERTREFICYAVARMLNRGKRLNFNRPLDRIALTVFGAHSRACYSHSLTSAAFVKDVLPDEHWKHDHPLYPIAQQIKADIKEVTDLYYDKLLVHRSWGQEKKK